MKKHNVLFLVFMFALLGLTGCEGDDDDKSSCQGQSTYAAPADQGGTPVPEERQPDMKLTITIDASAAWDHLQNAACAIGSGELSGSVESSSRVESNGWYSTTFTKGQIEARNPICGVIKNYDVKAVSNVSVTATLPASDENCENYCEAKAKVECQGSSDMVRCAGDVFASCSRECKSSSKIVGHGRITAHALSQLNSDLKGSADVDAHVDIVFDSVRD